MPREPCRAGRFIGAIGCVLGLASSCGGDYSEESAPAKDAGSDVATSSDTGATNDAADAAEIRTPVTPLSFVTRKVFLGETDRNGVDDANAWQKYGRDIDGIVSTTTANGECKPRGNSTAMRVDGSGGVDNSFGKNLIGIMKVFAPGTFPTKDANAAIASGVRVAMIVLDGHTGFFVYSEKTLSAPTRSSLSSAARYRVPSRFAPRASA